MNDNESTQLDPSVSNPPEAVNGQKQPSRLKTLVIGPTQSGKTALLAALRWHADVQGVQDDATTISVTPDPGCAHTRILWDSLEQQLTALGVWPTVATSAADAYQFSIHVETTPTEPTFPYFQFRWLREFPWVQVKPISFRRSFGFNMMDSPGEAVFSRGAHTETDLENGSSRRSGKQGFAESNAQLIEQGKAADGLIICIDGSEKAYGYIDGLGKYFEQVGANQFKRIAFAITKADQYFAGLRDADSSKTAFDIAEDLKNVGPVRFLRENMPKAVWGRLTSYIDPNHTKLACGWTSAFGFIPNDGRPNFDGEGRFATYNKEDPSWINTVVPYQVMDPFVFVATGRLGGLAPFVISDMRR